MTILPIRGVFEDWRALLHHIMEDQTVKHVLVITVCGEDADPKGRQVKVGHYEMTREELAYAALLIGREAFKD